MTVKIFFTIDTEEDLWGKEKRPINNPVENINAIPVLQKLFDQYNAIPTYLINYPVVTNDHAVNILNKIAKKGRCEIGTHCHPWNTPPLKEELTSYNTMLCNLPDELVYEKIKTIHKEIIHKFATTPISFRAGRWGFSSGVAKSISKLGYKVDTSITPFIDWSKEHGPDYSEARFSPYQIDLEEILSERKGSPLLEMPPTIGYLQIDFEKCDRLRKFILKSPLSHLRLLGLLDKMKVINRRWLSPEVSSGTEMIRLSQNYVRRGATCLNVSFHSTCLLPGKSPFVKTRKDLGSFFGKIETFLSFAKKKGWQFVPLRDVLKD